MKLHAIFKEDDLEIQLETFCINLPKVVTVDMLLKIIIVA